MSGPKVWVVVSPAEIARLEAERNRLLQELRNDIAEWKTALTALEALTDQKIVSTENNLKSIQSAYTERAFDKGRSLVRAEQQRLRASIEEATIEKKAKDRERRRRLQTVARAVAQQCVQSNKPVPKELKEVLDHALECSDETFLKFQKAVHHASPNVFDTVEVASKDNTLSPDFVATLSAGMTGPERFNAKNEESNQAESKNKRLDRLVAEIETYELSDKSKTFLERAESISSLASDSERELLTDSLIIDLSDYCAIRKAQADARQVLLNARADMAEISLPDAADLSKQIETALKSPEIKSSEDLAARVRDSIRREECRLAATAKRNSILQAFGKLGYDVRQGMDTAWAKDGKIVLSKKNTPDHGVELGATANMEKLQLRAVGIGSKTARNSEQDKQIELDWCTEFSKIRELLKDSGHQTHLEKEVAAGAFPLKTYEQQAWIEESEDDLQACGLKEKISQYLGTRKSTQHGRNSYYSFRSSDR